MIDDTGNPCPDCNLLTGGRCWRHAQPWITVPTVTTVPRQSAPLILQGWECPRCKSIYAPFVVKCLGCSTV